MVQRLRSFLVVSLLMFVGNNFCEAQTGRIKLPINHKMLEEFDFEKILRSGDTIKHSVIFLQKESCHIPRFRIGPGYSQLSILKQPGSEIGYHLPASTYLQSIGFICRKEWQLEKITSLPMRFRLGSLDYVNYMEQKPNASKPPR